MPTEIIRNLTPEEQELEKKQNELASLEADLIQRELELVTLRAELTAFEGHYLRKVGVLYAELDELEAQIAEAQARGRPDDSTAQEEAARARTQAQESSQTARAVVEPRAQPTEALKKLFREVAKRIHPDLATDGMNRAQREKLMAEANRAYEEGDEAKLRSILEGWETSPDTVEGEGIGADLIRLVRNIAQIEKRLIEIEAEIQQLKTSDLYQLRAKADEAEMDGRDLLEDMASEVKEQIDDAKERLGAVAKNDAAT